MKVRIEVGQSHCFTTDINVAAALHFLASIPNTRILEYGVEPGEIARRLARNPIRVEDGFVRIPEELGLGVEPDEACAVNNAEI